MWWSFVKSLFRGSPEATTGMRAHGTGKSEASGGIVIDGFDDAANALQGSGVSKQLAPLFRRLSSIR